MTSVESGYWLISYLSGFICVRDSDSVWCVWDVVIRLVLMNVLQHKTSVTIYIKGCASIKNKETLDDWHVVHDLLRWVRGKVSAGCPTWSSAHGRSITSEGTWGDRGHCWHGFIWICTETVWGNEQENQCALTFQPGRTNICQPPCGSSCGCGWSWPRGTERGVPAPPHDLWF